MKLPDFRVTVVTGVVVLAFTAVGVAVAAETGSLTPSGGERTPAPTPTPSAVVVPEDVDPALSESTQAVTPAPEVNPTPTTGASPTVSPTATPGDDSHRNRGSGRSGEDDHGDHVEPGDDHGHHAEPGDDHRGGDDSGHRSGEDRGSDDD